MGDSIPERVRRLWNQAFDHPKEPPVDRGPRVVRRDHDADDTDEAAAMIARLGGDVWAGDVVEIDTSDPAFWNASSFTLSFQVGAVALAQTGDQRGHFTWNVFFLAPNQGADIVVIEGDMPSTARAYLGVRGPVALQEELARYRTAYLRDVRPEVAYDVATDGLGTWTAYQVRGDGRFWLRHGASENVPTSAGGIDGVRYGDASFYYGPSLGAAGWIIRIMEYGGFGHAFQMESLPLSAVRFWRRDRPTVGRPSG
jgi:hypothetical protein